MFSIIASSYGNAPPVAAPVINIIVNEAVEHTLAGTTGTATSFTALPSINDIIVVCISAYESGGGNSPSSVVDNQGNTYTLAVQSAQFYTSNRCREHIYYATVSTTPTGTFTVTCNFTITNDTAVVIARISGVNATPLRGTPQSATGATTATNANVATDSSVQVGDLILGCACAAINGSNDVGWGSAAAAGYTNIGKEKNFSSINSISADYKIAAASGIDTETWTHNSTIAGTNGWGCCVAVFAHQ